MAAAKHKQSDDSSASASLKRPRTEGRHRALWSNEQSDEDEEFNGDGVDDDKAIEEDDNEVEVVEI